MQRYAIQPCDTLYGISNRFGVTLPQLLAVNTQINNSKPILVGQIINIPSYTYTVRPGDTLNKISKQFNVPLNLLISTNPQILCRNYITVGQKIFITGVPSPINAPKQVDAIESNAEDIIDDVSKQDWNKANKKLSIINNSLYELMPILKENSVSVSLINSIKNAITNLNKEVVSKKVYESKVQANLITMYVSDILDYFKTEIPTDIGRLDYLGRAIALNAEKNDWDYANDNFEYINVIWKNLKTKMLSEYNKDIIEFSQIIDSLGQLIKNKDSVQIIKKANEMLDKVDILEDDFKKQNENKNPASNPTSSVTPSSKVKEAVLPKQIEEVESNSEDIVDDINNNDWTKAQTRVDQIKLNVNELKPILVAASIPYNIIEEIIAAVSNLEKEVKAKNIYESKVQANQITKYIPDISDYYIVVLPTDLGRLDYLGREIALNADVEDWASASSNFEEAKNIWGNLKSKLGPTYKNDADKYQSSIDNLNKYINQKDAVLTKKEANVLLDLTDVLETDFKKQIKG